MIERSLFFHASTTVRGIHQYTRKWYAVLVKTRHVLLIGEKQLLGESLKNLLKGFDDIQLSGPKSLSSDYCAHITEIKPDVVLIAQTGNQHEEVASVAARILDLFPNILVIHSSLDRNVVRIYTSKELPARTEDLIDAIRSMPDKEMINAEVTSPEN